jgi:peptidoglycan/LPS O-acetylase OafA/YrhL
VPLIFFALVKLKTRKRINAVLAAAYVAGFLYSLLWAFLAEKLDTGLAHGIRESSDYIAYFATGIFCLVNLDWVKKRGKYFIVPALIAVVLEYIFTFNAVLEFLLPAALGVVIMFIAYNFSALRGVGKNGDYSYGVYIFHAPLIKIIIFFGYYGLNKDAALLLATGTVFSVAYMSWHFLEKKALKRGYPRQRPSRKASIRSISAP